VPGTLIAACQPKDLVSSLNESEADGQAGGQFWIAVKAFKEKIPYLFRSSSIIILLAVRCWI